MAMQKQTHFSKRTLYIFFFVFLMGAPLYAYIDPATGSMLFTAIAGIVASSYFFLKQIYMKLKFFSPSGKSNDPSSAIVIFSEGKQYWNVFKPVIDYFIQEGISCSYYSASQDDPGLSYPAPGIHQKFIGKGNKAYMKLNMLEADICLCTTPGLDVLQFKRSKKVKHYAHICHATDNTATYRLYSLDFFDSVLLNGPHQIPVIRELEQVRKTKVKELPVVGCTYLDVLQQKIGELPQRQDDNFTLLISPSWGPNGLLSKYGLTLIRPLAESGMNIILRPHPQSSISEIPMLEGLKAGLLEFSNIEWDFERDNILAMNRSDLMISDFSSVMYDFIFLFSKPVITINFNLDPRGFELSDLQKENPFYMVKDSGAILHVESEDFSQLPSYINSLSYDHDLFDNIEALSSLAWKFKGKSGENTGRYLLSLQEELLKS